MELVKRLALLGINPSQMLLARKAYTQAYHCYCQEIGGQENTVYDCGADSEDGQAAIKFMTNPEAVRNMLYNAFMGDTLYFEGGFGWGREAYLKELRFLGEENLRLIADWCLVCRDDEADYPCGWGLAEFNSAHPDHAQAL